MERIADELTDLARQRQELEQKQKELATLTENCPDLITRHGRDHRYLYVNGVIEQLTGIPAHEFIGKSYYELGMDETLCKYFDEQLSVVFTTRQPRDVEYEAIGTTSIIQSRMVPEFDDEGNVFSVLIFSRDIAAIKATEKELRHQGLLMDTVSDGIVSTDERFAIKSWNKGAEKMYGHTAAEAIGRLSNELMPLKYINDRREDVITTIGKAGYWAGEVMQQRKDGVWINVLASVAAIRDENGKLTGYVAANRDITSRRKIEEDLRRSEERLRHLADSMPQLVWMADADGKVHYYNNRIKEYKGPEQQADGSWSWSLMLHPDDIKATEEAWAKAVKEGSVYEVEHRVQMQDGSFKWHLSRGNPECNEAGDVLHWYGTATDISIQKQAELDLELRVKDRTAELLYANEMLEQSNRELEQYAYIASHDLQEPLRKIQTFTDMLISKAASNGMDVASRDVLQKVRASAERMGVLIADLLNFSRLTHAEEDKVPTDLNQTLANVLSDFELSIEQKEAAIHMDKLPEIIAAPLQMNQLFYNLINNSLKFTDPARKPQISISCTKLSAQDVAMHSELPSGRAYCRITVQDNGIGFDQQYAGQIFEIFKRLHNKQAFTGTGIGLALVRKIVQQHGGVITAEGRESEGASFHIVLPTA